MNTEVFCFVVGNLLISVLEFLEKQKSAGASLPAEQPVAEETFMRILKDAGVKSDWEWEQALRLIIDHPNYKCIPTLQERKEVFARYKSIQRGLERDERYLKLQEDREAFKKMLEEDPRIVASTRWSEAMDLLRNRDEFKGIASPRDRVELFEEYIAHLKRNKGGRKQSSVVLKFAELLRALPEITLETRWKEAIQIFSSAETYLASTDLQKLDPVDMLLEFEEYIKEMEAAEQRQKRQASDEKRRRERQARKELHGIIKELIDSGQFNALTTWKEFCALTMNHTCWNVMITAHSSDPTPLDYYWDALDELQLAYIPDRRIILKAVGEEPPKELRKFTDKVRKDEKFSAVQDLHHIELAFRELSLRKEIPPLECIKKPSPQIDTIDAPNVDRKLIDKYKYLIKHWTGQPITLSSAYDEFRPLLQSHEAFQAIPDESIRRLYFDKYIHHLKKKAGPTESERPIEDVEPEEGEVLEDPADYRPRRDRRYH